MTAAAAESPVTDRRLIIGPVPNDYDPLRDIVGGWWCFSGQEDRFPDWDSVDLKEPVSDPETIVAEFQAINALVNDLIISWSPKWNNVHNVNRSPKFWHLLSVGWLIDLVHLVRYRYLEIQQTLEQHSGMSLVASVPPVDARFRYNGYSEFAQASYADPALSAWISSLILHEIDAANVSLEVSSHQKPEVFEANAYEPRAVSTVRSTLRKLKASLKPDRCRIGSGAREFTPWLKFSTLFAEVTLATICRLSSGSPSLKYTAPRGSGGASEEYFSQTFLRILEKALVATTPEFLVGDFNNLDEPAARKTYHPGRMRVEVSFFHLDESRRFQIAHAVESGEVLVGAQHGANAGTAAAIQFAPETEYRYHAAITWGWTSCGGYPGNFIPLPSPQLAPWIGKHNPTEDTIVVVGTGVRFIPGRFSFEGDIFNRPVSRKEKSALFDTLDTNARSKIRYRPYFGMKSTLADASYFETKYPDIPQIKDSFFDRLMRCNLMIIDHPGTTMLQALAAGIPFVGFWTPAAFHMCPEAKAHFDRLRDANVIFNNGTDAARHVNEIANDIQSWWSQPDVQSAIHDVRDTYAMTSKTWLVDWAKALIRL